MAKASKAKTTTDAPTPVQTTPAVETAAAAPKAKKVKAVKETAAPVAVDAPKVVAPVVESIESSSLTDKSEEFFGKLQQLGAMISSVKTEYRSLQKQWSRDMKIVQKQSSKNKRKSGNRKPSGFVKPTRISDELASFLGKEKGTEMARTSVTKEINAYIRANNLQDSTNGRKINPDSKLTSLLKLTKEDQLTYFNLQKFMCHHFAKSVKPEAVVTAPVF
jgi:chromatin remodeling complex protein RSC6